MTMTYSPKYSETSIYHSRMYRFPGSIVRILWSLNKSYLNYENKTHIPFFDLSFSHIYWSEFLVPKNFNPGLIVFKEEQHTHMRAR
jgi:hypothetical protein